MKMKRRMNRNRLEKDLQDLLVPDHPGLRNQVEGLLDLLVPDHPDLRNQAEDLPDLLVPDHPDQRNREEDRLGLRNQGDPLDLLVPDLVGHPRDTWAIQGRTTRWRTSEGRAFRTKERWTSRTKERWTPWAKERRTSWAEAWPSEVMRRSFV